MGGTGAAHGMLALPDAAPQFSHATNMTCMLGLLFDRLQVNPFDPDSPMKVLSIHPELTDVSDLPDAC